MELHSPQSLYRTHGISVEPRPARRASMTSLLAKLGEIGRVISREMRHRRAVAELSEMDDHLLRDIGVSRTQIPYIVRHGRLELHRQSQPYAYQRPARVDPRR